MITFDLQTAWFRILLLTNFKTQWKQTDGSAQVFTVCFFRSDGESLSLCPNCCPQWWHAFSVSSSSSPCSSALLTLWLSSSWSSSSSSLQCSSSDMVQRGRQRRSANSTRAVRLITKNLKKELAGLSLTMVCYCGLRSPISSHFSKKHEGSQRTTTTTKWLPGDHIWATCHMSISAVQSISWAGRWGTPLIQGTLAHVTPERV